MPDAMTTEIHIQNQEKREFDLVSCGPWLGGIYETGGNAEFSIGPHKASGKTYIYSHPVLRVQDNNPDFVQKLKDLFGGSARPTGNSWRWQVKGNKAIELAFLMEPYAPSKQGFIEALDQWRNTNDREERLEIARDFEQLGKPDYGTTEDYDKLIEDPRFVAGIIDNRGALYYKEGGLSDENSYGYVWPELRVQTQNRTLLESLSRKFGGTIITMAEAGTTRKARGKDVVVKRDILYWGLGSKDTQSLLAIIQPYLLLGKIKGAQQ
ncbi:MAG TPA: hypothetical protein VLE91_02650 [Candidatus Saccharimonadales bacterium]|nr:hypothetical protein [Candidatus Saccharimonadales bacterium]